MVAVQLRILPLSFYQRPADIVALDLLGKVLEASPGPETRRCRIMETEAYFGPCDPASRARRGRRGRIAKALHGPQGLTLVYGMHRQWLLNIVAHPGWMAGAVLLRSCQPIQPPHGNPRGPGRLTRYMGIDKSMDSKPVYTPTSPVRVLDDGYRPPEVRRSRRIGVSEDLELPLRYYIPL